MEGQVKKPATPAHKTRRHPSKACNPCKQQKLRCSAQTDYPEPCNRCRKLGLECRVEDGFRRVNKRLRTETLEIENEALRQRLESNQHGSPGSGSSNLARSTVTPSGFSVPTPAYTDEDIKRAPPSYAEAPSIVEESPTLGEEQPAHTFPPMQTYPPSLPSPTLPRIIGGIKVEAAEIDDIFAIYFTHYATHLPILNPHQPPNKYYEESPLLFWAIIGVGARRYTGNPTLLTSIADLILHLGWPPLHATPAIVPAIKGLLLLSSFPLPTDSTFKDNSYTLSGMAVNLGLQIGLHVPLHRHEFSRNEVNYAEDAIGRRVRLWFHCIVVHQKAACCLGYPITVSPDRLRKQMDLRGLLHLVPSSLMFEVRLGSLLSRINPLFSPASSVGDEEHSKFARARIADAFEAELYELGAEQNRSDLENLQLNIARLQLRVHYLRDCDSLASHSMARLGVSATAVIALVEKLAITTKLAIYCPHYIFRLTALAAAVVLRMLKAMQASPQVDTDTDAVVGYKSYLFKAISLFKEMSVEDNDGPSRMARILSRLWSSEVAFSYDGSLQGQGQRSGKAVFGMLVQSRLAMSILHDTTHRYRELFGSIVGGNQQGSSGGRPSQVRPEAGASGGSMEANAAQPQTVEDEEAQRFDLPPGSLGFASMIWDGPFDQGFESMIEAFPESWPL